MRRSGGTGRMDAAVTALSVGLGNQIPFPGRWRSRSVRLWVRVRERDLREFDSPGLSRVLVGEVLQVQLKFVGSEHIDVPRHVRVVIERGHFFGQELRTSLL